MRDFQRYISVKEMQIHDKNSSDFGISPSILMECAGYSAALKIIEKYNLKKKNNAVVVCGTGNNGGDGFVIARHLLTSGIKVDLFLVGDPSKIRTQEARKNWNILQNFHFGVSIYKVKDSSFFTEIGKKTKTRLKKSKIIVDCLLGTGIKGNVREPVRSAIQFVNSFSEHDTKIIAIDVPSGIDPDTGEKADCWIQADFLITFHKKKNGFENIDIETMVNPIGIPLEADMFVGSGDVKFNVPKRARDNHKGQYGKVLVIGGSSQYSGAPSLAAMAALQMGIDLVYVFAPRSVADVIRTFSPNLIVQSGVDENLCWKDVPTIKKLINKVDAVVLGPGMGTNPETEKAFPYIVTHLKEKKKPVVIDADAIELSKSLKNEIQKMKVVMTPHSNEFLELTGKKLPNQENFMKRIGIIEKVAKDWKTIFLIKGQYDYISDGNSTRINKTGVPEMAVGGTGDILAGLVGSILALKVNPFNAACCAAFINGKSGEFIQNSHLGINKNRVPLKSSDLLDCIPKILHQYT